MECRVRREGGLDDPGVSSYGWPVVPRTELVVVFNHVFGVFSRFHCWQVEGDQSDDDCPGEVPSGWYFN